MAGLICVLCTKHMELMRNGKAFFIYLSCSRSETIKRIYIKFAVKRLH
jgi:hypothetical protein